jgi:ATP-dependent DNA helicase RecG
LEIVKSTVAFANTDGGTIFVGVDDEGVPLGIAAARRCFKTLDPIEAQMSRLKSLITNNTKPVPSVTYTVVDVNGSRLVVVEVKKSPTICSTQDNRVYVRRGSTSRLADPNSELPSLIRGSGLDFESSGGGTYGI